MLIRKLLKRKIQEVECDLLSKAAYVTVRWARSMGPDDVTGRAINAMKADYPDIDRDRIEQAVFAMDLNARLESGVK